MGNPLTRVAESARYATAPPLSIFAHTAGSTTRLSVISIDGPEWNLLEEHEVSEAMTRPPIITLSSDASVEDAARTMGEKGIHRVLVAAGDTIIGIISTTDLAKVVASAAWRSERQ